ncbi:cytochrome c [Cytophagaceae bacterium YF14B1]|uniref:Cytochrome c n=1 Tax=Xanthocytophaga flava TaxID=3048013 RepID=A0AAE3QPJ8_9BACT|nr:cytochrome c [Xanthocytophaga flavus]MDJ1483117.1 cytochrome c [Xanthocytophaga flavus]
MKRLVLLLLSSCILFACHSTQDEKPIKQTSPQPAKQKAISPEAVMYKQGKKLFIKNCEACHSKTHEIIVGPGLKDVTKRQSREWIRRWIRNSWQMRTDGDEYGTKLFEEYNRLAMQSFPDLTDKDIDAILFYIEF